MDRRIAVTVDSDGSFDIWTIPTCPNKLLSLIKEQVGGYIEVVPLRDSLALVLNEDGKLRNLPANPIATNIAQESEAICQGDYIAGAAVLIPMRWL